MLQAVKSWKIYLIYIYNIYILSPSFLFTWQLLYTGSAGGPKPFYEALEQELDAACSALQTNV